MITQSTINHLHDGKKWWILKQCLYYESQWKEMIENKKQFFLQG